MSVFAVTGNLGSGKSLVTKLLKSKGAVIFDADSQVHKYYRNKKNAVHKAVAAAFPEVVKGKSISCRKLADIVFSSKRKLQRLERLVHPAIIKDLKKWVKQAKNKKRIYVAEVPLLFEKNLQSLFDGVIVVDAKRQVCISRICKSFSLSKKEAQRRLTLFFPIKNKLKKADFIIKNNSDTRSLRKKVNILWKDLKEY